MVSSSLRHGKNHPLCVILEKKNLTVARHTFRAVVVGLDVAECACSQLCQDALQLLLVFHIAVERPVPLLSHPKQALTAESKRGSEATCVEMTKATNKQTTPSKGSGDSGPPTSSVLSQDRLPFVLLRIILLQQELHNPFRKPPHLG